MKHINIYPNYQNNDKNYLIIFCKKYSSMKITELKYTIERMNDLWSHSSGKLYVGMFQPKQLT
uniref:Uncharacterized protein n=1 Tax=Schistosoma haematobium TaxID=6185 RepID=A0A095C037_SCHHA